MTPEHERYIWLRDKKTRYGGYCGSAPFVMSPSKSRLYAIHKLVEDALDAEIDSDILDNKVEDLHQSNEIVERGIMVYPDRYSEEYNDALFKLAQIELGWDDTRTNLAMNYDT